MNKYCIAVLFFAISVVLTSCDQSIQNPNTMFSENYQDPITELEVTSAVDRSQFRYKQTFYVPIYSDIYTDRENLKVPLSATPSGRNTSPNKPLYINKID